MTEYLIILGGVFVFVAIAVFLAWLGNRSASDAGAAKAEAAQATAEATASSAALNAAVQGTSDAQIVDDLKRGQF